jgi:poly-gamma-glutamate capsule biosynthesis protein CapA/YwtB (metallophosphatase superfamily)
MKKNFELLSVLFGVLLVLVVVLFLSVDFFVKKPTARKYSESGKIKPDEPTITLVTTGDVMLGRSVNLQIIKNNNPGFPFEKVASFLSPADITYINLENPLTDPCPQTDEGMIFCAPTSSAKGLTYAGFDVVNLANNHTKNFGQAGYQQTIDALNKESILYSDSDNLAEVHEGDTKFGFLGFDLVSKKMLENDIKSKIAIAKNRVDILVVGFHWGQEYSKTPSEYQRKIARLAIDSGADLIIGHHPHVVQSIEVYKDKVIFYSLGNFVFDQLWSEETRKGELARFVFKDKKLVSYGVIPIYINNFYQPEISLNSNAKSDILPEEGIEKF